VPARSTARRPSHATEPGPFSLRGWLVVAGGVLSGAIILFAWLPVGALLSQHAQLTSAESRLAQLSREANALTAESNELRSPVALDQLAREEYQLVAPGQRLVQVLTPTFTPSSKSSTGPFPGDPGFAALVNPLGTTAEASTAPGSSATTPSSSTTPSIAAHATAPVPGFFSRVLSTLEFWR
jgi:Septum formation initiator